MRALHRVTCPQCQKVYVPDLETSHPEGVTIYLGPKPRPFIQDIFPHATSTQREQLQSGFCSDACWEAAFGPEE